MKVVGFKLLFVIYWVWIGDLRRSCGTLAPFAPIIRGAYGTTLTIRYFFRSWLVNISF